MKEYLLLRQGICTLYGLYTNTLPSSSYQSIHPSIHPSMHLQCYLSIHLSIYLSIHLFIHPSIYLSIYLSIHLSIYFLSIYSFSSLENLLQASPYPPPPPPPPPPSENPLRPHTASEFRLNRYKKPHIRSHTAGNSRDPNLNIDKQNGRTISTSPDLQRTTEQNVLLSAKIHPIRTRRVYINHSVS